MRYIGLLRDFDSMIAKYDALWLSGVISGSDYSKGIFEMKRGLLRLSGRAGMIYRRTQDAARRKQVNIADQTSNGSEGDTTVIDNADALPVNQPTPLKQRRKTSESKQADKSSKEPAETNGDEASIVSGELAASNTKQHDERNEDTDQSSSLPMPIAAAA